MLNKYSVHTTVQASIHHYMCNQETNDILPALNALSPLFSLIRMSLMTVNCLAVTVHLRGRVRRVPSRPSGLELTWTSLMKRSGADNSKNFTSYQSSSE